VYVSDVTPSVSEDITMISIPDAYNQIAEYPIAMTTEAGNEPAAQEFIDFVLSPTGQEILESFNFIPIAQ
jgi:molybdate transport system substrate-binding protein